MVLELIEEKNPPVQIEEEIPIQEIPWIETAKMFYTNKAAVAGLGALFIVLIVALFGPIFFPLDPFRIVGPPLASPSGTYYLGTDYLGRDVFLGLVYGARPTFLIAIVATVFTVTIGTSVGATAGFFGGKIDIFLMRFTEFFQVLPPLVFAMVIVGVFGTNFLTVVIAIGVTTWTSLARLTRAEFLKLKEKEFVMSAIAIGASNLRLIVRVILPNALPPLIIAITLRIGLTIIYEAALSFLGLTSPDIMTWGKMIGLSRDFFFEAWWTVTFPGVAILITVLCIALIGDGLNDALNPKLRGR